ncbi:MAG TPA: CDGSH iron-sulfur domain-containing protein [Angustibacter sp.]|nr:CDGSH iron-sulfur domain-containing protein [Angustibacter sp.]
MSATPPPTRGARVIEIPDGPLVLRDAVAILGDDGAEVPMRRATVALCRCGKSGIAPWCDGTHRLLNRVRRADD